MWPHGQAVKTPPFHGGNMGSSPVGVTKQVKGEPVSFRRRIRLYHILQKDLLTKRRARVYLTRCFFVVLYFEQRIILRYATGVLSESVQEGYFFQIESMRYWNIVRMYKNKSPREKFFARGDFVPALTFGIEFQLSFFGSVIANGLRIFSKVASSIRCFSSTRSLILTLRFNASLASSAAFL